jgi:hypothetical protein
MDTTTHDKTISADTRRVRIIALIAAHIYAVIAFFQISLAMGAPFGEVVWGGGHDPVLPPGLRIASAIAAVMLIWMLLVVLARAGVVRIEPVRRAYLAGFTWAVAGFMALNTMGNVASKSLFEQRVLAPVTAILTALTAVVAHRGGRGAARVKEAVPGADVESAADSAPADA